MSDSGHGLQVQPDRAAILTFRLLIHITGTPVIGRVLESLIDSRSEMAMIASLSHAPSPLKVMVVWSPAEFKGLRWQIHPACTFNGELLWTTYST